MILRGKFIVATCGPKHDRKMMTIGLSNNAKRIGVMVSGGADSAILLYILAQEISLYHPHCEIRAFTVPRHDGAILYSPGIVEHVNRELGVSIPPPIVVGNPDLVHYEQVRSGYSAALKEHGVELLYLGDQQPPPPPFMMRGLYPERLQSTALNRLRAPFQPLHKTHTIDLFFLFGQLELLKRTHSCTNYPLGICGSCFQCDERHWAFEQLGYVDPANFSQ